MPNDTEYITKWHKENMQNAGFLLRNDEFEAFDSLCKSIKINRATFLKQLVNEYCEKHRISPIFRDLGRSTSLESVEVPTHYINAIEYAQSNNIKRTTMLQRLKSGKYPSVIHTNGKWYIDPNEII